MVCRMGKKGCTIAARKGYSSCASCAAIHAFDVKKYRKNNRVKVNSRALAKLTSMRRKAEAFDEVSAELEQAKKTIKELREQLALLNQKQ